MHLAIGLTRMRLKVVVLLGICVLVPPHLFCQPLNEHKPSAPVFQSSDYCKQCHPGIYKYWTNSIHAQSISDPIFQTAYNNAITTHGEKVKALCLSCHSPTTIITKDFDLKDQISREGVTCDFCHTVTNVVQNKPQNLFEVQLGETKFGPLPNAQPIADLVFRYSALHRSAKLCSGCHELESPNGVKVLATYSEWQGSPYAKQGIQCQNCHMPELIDVPVVPPDIRPVSDYAHAHDFLGGHSQIRLEKAASLELVTRREENRILVDVFVTNEEAGHCLPTGMPSRKIVLEVSLKDDRGHVLKQDKREYQKILLDEKSHPIQAAEHAILEAIAVQSDNRIKPKEVRHEEFHFEGLPTDKPLLVSGSLKYRAEAPTPEKTLMVVEMASVLKILPGQDEGATYKWPYILIIGFSFIILALSLLFFVSLHRGR